jgi:beta-lactamase regulating signal transducer with metallopeptidase domain
MAFVFPASAWISRIAATFSMFLATLLSAFPNHIHAESESIIARVIPVIWVLGSLVLFATWCCRLRRSSHGLSIASPEEQAALDRVKKKCGLHASIGICCSEKENEPALLGVVRPQIAIPYGLSSQLSETEFEAVLLHELAHARRGDNLVSAFVHCLVCIFWFHPLLWFVEKQLLAERERACDGMVVDSGITPEIYLMGLIKVCKFHLFRDIAGVSAANGSELGDRFDRILAHRTKSQVPNLARFATVAGALLLALVPLAGGYCEQCVSNSQAARPAADTRR